MRTDASVSVRMLGCLHTLRRERGLSAVVDITLPPEGKSAADLARDLDLPLEKIEAVFCNHVTYDLGHVIHPGDQVAFVPHGTPGPHRFTLGIHQAGTKKPNPGSGAL